MCQSLAEEALNTVLFVAETLGDHARGSRREEETPTPIEQRAIDTLIRGSRRDLGGVDNVEQQAAEAFQRGFNGQRRIWQ